MLPPLPASQVAVVRIQYPHMGVLDAIVWTTWLQDCELELDAVWYDLKVGTPITLPPEADPALLAIADGTGSKRIDAVLQVGGDYWCIEVKPEANHLAIGQVLTYADLLPKRYTIPGRIVPTIVSVTIDPDIRALARRNGIQLLTTKTNPWPTGIPTSLG